MSTLLDRNGVWHRTCLSCIVCKKKLEVGEKNLKMWLFVFLGPNAVLEGDGHGGGGGWAFLPPLLCKRSSGGTFLLLFLCNFKQESPDIAAKVLQARSKSLGPGDTSVIKGGGESCPRCGGAVFHAEKVLTLMWIMMMMMNNYCTRIIIIVIRCQVGSMFTTPAVSPAYTATNSSILDPWLMLLMERCTVINITNYIVIINVIVIITIITMSIITGVLQSLLCCNLHALPLPRSS